MDLTCSLCGKRTQDPNCSVMICNNGPEDYDHTENVCRECYEQALADTQSKPDKRDDAVDSLVDQLQAAEQARDENYAWGHRLEDTSRQLYEALVEANDCVKMNGFPDGNSKWSEAIRAYESHQTAAFCAYVMAKENCTQPDALKRMAEMYTVTELMLIGVRSRGKQEETSNGDSPVK